MAKEFSGKLEWRINVPNGTWETLVPESGALAKIWLWLKGLLVGFAMKVWRFLEKAWSIGVAEPKKVIHAIKVGLALSIVSLFYYMRPLYDGFGRNTMWAIMTVVVVFESTVGATFSKCINRAAGTFLAGILGVGVNWAADHSGEQFEPIILGFSVFLFASAATYSRFIPSVKARFDYGALIFILTFTLVSVSGYRVEKLFELANQRLYTIGIGASLCILVSMFFCPIWAGTELQKLIHRNMEKLAASLEGCVTEYFEDKGKLTASDQEDPSKKMQEYKSVINSKPTEESLANFARWEPAHGRFNFRHPWKQYVKIGASMRGCAYCIETLNGCVNSEIQAPTCMRKYLKNVSMRLSLSSTKVLKELAMTIKTMRKSSKIDLSVSEMNSAVEELQNAIKSLPNHLMISSTSAAVEGSGSIDAKGKPTSKATTATAPALLEILPLVTVVSLLIEIAARIRGIVDAVEELAVLAEFKPAATEKKPKENQPSTDKPISDNRDSDS